MARILAIHAHPDDIEILMGGTLARLGAGGHEITMCSMTAGDCGTKELGPEEISSIRRKEAAAAAELIGAQYVCGGFLDLAIFNEDESRRRVTGILRRVRPDLVITAAPVDYHCDHEATSHLVRDACFGAGAPNYRAASGEFHPALKEIPHLYFCDPIEGVDREGNLQAPEFLVDVTATFETKRAMLACHDSQREWLRAYHGMDNYLDTMEQWTRARGQLLGVPYAEGFRQYKGHPYPATPLLQQLLAL